jgi:hypothetical protein
MTTFKKKVLAFALAGTMIIPSTGAAFAATSTEKLDKIVDLGVIQGEGNGVVSNEVLSRYRAFVLQIRLAGKLTEFENYNAEGKDTFKDAALYSPFVQKLASFLKTHPELGVVGYEDGTLRPLEDITAQEYIVVMLKALGYQANVDFTWESAMALAASAGINATTAATKALTVADTANYTYDSLSSKAKNTDGTLGEKLGYAIVDTLGPVASFNSLETIVYSSKTTLNGKLNEKGTLKINGKAVTVNADLSFTTTVDLVEGSNKITVETTDVIGNKAVKEITVKRVINALSIEQTTSDSNKQFQITFNNEIDPATVKAENFTIKNNTVAKVQLEDNNKTITVIVNSKFDQQSEQTISKIENIKDVNGNTIATVKDLKFTSKDVTLPKITKVETERNSEIRLTFSEPVQELQVTNTSNYTLNGERFVGTIKNFDYNTVILYSKNFKADNELVVKNIKDYNSLIMDAQTLDFAYGEDKVAPTVTEITDATLESVKVKFDEKIDFSSVKKENIKWAYNISSTSGKAATAVEKIDDTTILVYFKGDSSLPPANVNIIFNAIKDLSGNVIAKDSAVAVTPVIDETRPEVVALLAEYLEGATSTSNGTTKFTVTFSKNVVDADSVNNLVNNFELLDKDGKKVSKTISLDGTYATATNKVIFTVSNLTEGDYTLTIKNFKDDTKLANKMLDTTRDFAVVNKKAPAIVKVFKDAANKKLYVQFSESMNSTITDSANYMIKKGSQWVQLSKEIDGAITTMENEKYAVITLKNALADYSTLEIALVQNAAGNVLGDVKTTVDLTTGIDEITQVAPSINKVEVTAKDQLKVYLDKEIVDAYYKDFAVSSTVSDSVYYNDKVANFDFAATTVDNKKVSVITIDFDTDVFGADGKFVNGEAVKVSASSDVLYTVDAFGNELTGTQTGLDKLGSKLIATDSLVNANVANTAATLTFDEAIVVATELNSYAANDFVVVNNEGKTLTAGVDYTVAVVDGKIVVTFATAMAGDYTIATAATINFIKDAAGNAIKAFSDITIVRQ